MLKFRGLKAQSDTLRVLSFLLFVLLIGLLPAQTVQGASSKTFTVNNNGDAADADLDDGDCDTDLITPGFQCTLRAAIQQANVPNSVHDTINFQSGVVLISPSSALPALTNNYGATIYSDHYLLLNGTSVSGDGLTLASHNNKVMGLVIAGFDNGVLVTGHYNVIGTDGDGSNDANEMNIIYSNDDGTGYGINLSGDHNVVAGNYIGTTNGLDVGANTIGIMVSGDDNRIGTNGDGTSDTEERNVISGNSQHGIRISGGTSALAEDTIVAGNYIGVNKDGDTAVPNGSNGNGDGIDIDVRAACTQVGTDSDGTADAAEMNVISGNVGDGVRNHGDYTTIAGNYIGTNAAGNAAIPNGGYGVVVTYSSDDALIGTDGDGTRDTIEGNTISGNTSGGVNISNNNRGTRIAGNKIGTNPAGTAALANVGDGVYAEGIGEDLVIGTNGDGTADANEGNIISGNGQNGVHLSSGMSGAEVAGNYIGTNASGSAAIANGTNGVLVDGGANSNIIGSDYDGTADTQERNLISGNTQSGVRIEGDGTDSNQIVNNYIGTNESGNSALGNDIGVRVDDLAKDTHIGPITYSVLGNVVSGNTSDGIYLGGNSDSTEIWENIIGMDISKSSAVSNGRHGIYITDGTTNSSIVLNTIAHNTEDGIFMSATAGSDNLYESNRIFSNGGLGVDLAPDGVNPNDFGDADTGPNDLMNYPEFRRLVHYQYLILLEVVFYGEPDQHIPFYYYLVESCDPSGYGEGGGESGSSEFQGIGLDTDSSGIGVFAIEWGAYRADRPYMVLTTGFSEFSECKLIEPAESAKIAQLSIADVSQNEGDSGSTWMDFDVTLDRTATITVSASYRVDDGTAKDGQDYQDSSGTVTFSPGTTKQTISVEIFGDTTVEPHETIIVKLQSPVGAQIQDSEATGMILDDDGTTGGYWVLLPLITR
jgi:CSLREA domain-containing protein